MEEQNIPITVFCLVDTSGSINTFKKSLLQDTLLEISSSLNSQDSMVIAEVNNQVIIGDPLYLQEDRDAAIRRITVSNQDTNLYAGIVESINQIGSNESYNPYTCLVILSDGVDAQDNGFTENEVITAVKESRVPVFTVALVQNYTERVGAKILGSFARASYGGQHFTTAGDGSNEPIRQDIAGEEFGAHIWESLMSTRILTAKISDASLYEGKTHAELTVQCKSGENLYEDSISVKIDDSIFQTTGETTVPVATETESTADGAKDPPPPEVKRPFYWIVLATVGVLAALFAFLSIRAKAKKSWKESQQQENKLEASHHELKEIPMAKPEAKAQIVPKYKVFITDIPYGTQRISLTLKEEKSMSFGRNSRCDFILNAKDPRLSGKHFSLLAEKGVFHVRDEGSLNGTYLNGVRIKRDVWTKMCSADKIRAGSYEYRITIDLIQENST